MKGPERESPYPGAYGRGTIFWTDTFTRLDVDGNSDVRSRGWNFTRMKSPPRNRPVAGRGPVPATRPSRHAPTVTNRWVVFGRRVGHNGDHDIRIATRPLGREELTRCSPRPRLVPRWC